MRDLLIEHIEEDGTEQCVIIRSNDAVNTNLFRDIIISSYKQLKACNILILGGVHGTPDGSITTEGEDLTHCFGDGEFVKKKM